MGRQEQRIKELVLNRVTKCGQCGGGYGESDVNVLGHKEDLWFLMLICGHCHQAVGVAAVVKDQPSASVRQGEESDRQESAPSSVEPQRVAGSPVTGEDVAGVHDFLADFDGDFKRLFGDRV